MICERCRLEYYSAICPRCYYVRRETTMAEINRRQEEIGEMEERNRIREQRFLRNLPRNYSVGREARENQFLQERQFGNLPMPNNNLIILAIARLSIDRLDLKEQCDTVISMFEDLGNEFRDCSYLYTRYREEHMLSQKISDEPKPVRRIRTSPLTKE